MSSPTPPDPLDQDLAAAFAHLKPSEPLVNQLIAAAKPQASPSPWSRSIPTAVLLLAAAAAVSLVVLGRGPDVPEPPTAASAVLPVPAGMRAVTVTIPEDALNRDDLVPGAAVDLQLVTFEKTRGLGTALKVLQVSGRQLTLACPPADAEKLVLGTEMGTLVPVVHDGGSRLTTIAVDPAPIQAGFVQAGMHVDLLVTLHNDGTLETLTLLQDVEIRRVHDPDRVTVVVDPAAAQRLIHASSQGSVSLSVRGE